MDRTDDAAPAPSRDSASPSRPEASTAGVLERALRDRGLADALLLEPSGEPTGGPPYGRPPAPAPATARGTQVAAPGARRTRGRGAHRRRAGPVAAALLSALLPGLGQLAVGRRRRGLVMVVVSLAAVAAAWAWMPAADDRLSLLVRPGFLVGVLAVDVALLGFRLGAVLDAYAVGRRTRRGGGVLRLAAFWLVVGLTTAPHAVVAYYDLEAHDLVTSVFEDDAGSGSLFEDPAPLVAPTDVPRHAFAPGGNEAPKPTRRLRGRLEFLLIGGDAGPGRSGLRTDTMIVASVRRSTNQVAMFGIPRNLWGIPLPEPLASRFACRCFPYQVNELYAWGAANAWLFPGAPDPGAAALRAGLGELLGLEVDHHVIVDLPGFVDVVDALGGVAIELRYGLRGSFSPSHEGAEWLTIDLPPGTHDLTGEQALAYVRARQSSSDYDRMRRQRCLLGAVARQARPLRLLRALPTLKRTVKESVGTDIPIRALPELIEIATAVRLREVVATSLGPPAFTAGASDEGYPTPNVDLIRSTVAETLEHPRRAARAGAVQGLPQEC